MVNMQAICEFKKGEASKDVLWIERCTSLLGSPPTMQMCLKLVMQINKMVDISDLWLSKCSNCFNFKLPLISRYHHRNGHWLTEIETSRTQRTSLFPLIYRSLQNKLFSRTTIEFFPSLHVLKILWRGTYFRHIQKAVPPMEINI